jgi:hypothetical protein
MNERQVSCCLIVYMNGGNVSGSGLSASLRRSMKGCLLGRSEIFCMLHHLFGLLVRVFNSQVTGAKPLQVHNHFNLVCHIVDRQTFKERRSAAMAEWKSLAC